MSVSTFAVTRLQIPQRMAGRSGVIQRCGVDSANPKSAQKAKSHIWISRTHRPGFSRIRTRRRWPFAFSSRPGSGLVLRFHYALQLYVVQNDFSMSHCGVEWQVSAQSSPCASQPLRA